MRHAKRRKLMTIDFNNALQNADVQVTAPVINLIISFIIITLSTYHF